MASNRANRFALFAQNDGDKTSTSSKSAGGDIPKLTSQPGISSGNPGLEVKKQEAKTKKPTNVLDIRKQTEAAPATRERQRKPSTNDGMEPNAHGLGKAPSSENKPNNTHENWCGVCSVRFRSKIALQNHMKQSGGHDNYCNLCKRVFKCRNGLKNHLENSPGHETFCNLCLSAFNNRWGLKNHFENHSAAGHQFVCLTCLEGFWSGEQLDLHLRTAGKHVRCETCLCKFKSQDERDHHWVKTTKHRHCLQPGCDFDGPDAAVLETHLKEDHFQCSICRAVFPSATKLSVHTNNCSSALRCEGCQKLFPNQEDLTEHRKACFSCTDCPHWTDDHDAHLKHLSSHGKPVYKCWICAAPMLSQTHVIKHLETGKCHQLPDAATLHRVLGKWWYSVLYMDINIHASVRLGRVDMKEMAEWIKGGNLHPFICRAEGCGEKFGRFSSLVFHVENADCQWDVKRLRLDMLEKEFIRYLDEAGMFAP